MLCSMENNIEYAGLSAKICHLQPVACRQFGCYSNGSQIVARKYNLKYLEPKIIKVSTV